MKVKNIAFSGFAAMIFAGLCGAADAASVNLASKSYVDTQLAGKANLIDLEALEMTVGQKATQESLNTVATQVNQNTLDIADLKAAGYLTETDLNNLKTTLQAAIDEKQAAGDYLVAADLTELSSAVAALESGKADASTVSSIQETIGKLGDTYASKSELTSAEERLQAAIDAIDVPSLTEYAKTADVNAALELKADKSELTTLATTEALNNLQSTLQAAIDEKQAAGDYLVAADLTELSSAVAALESGKADASTVSSIQETIGKLGDTYASKSELTSAEERLQAAIDAIDVPSLTEYAKTADVDAALALKADKSELTNLVTSTQLTELRTALETEIAKKQDSGDYAAADALTAISTELSTLKGDVYTKAQVDAKIADAVSGGEIDLSGYAKQVDLDSLTALVNGNTAEITTLKNAGYQTSTQVSEAIAAATATLATKDELNAKQDTLTAGAGITITDNTISASVDTSSFVPNPTATPTTYGEYVLMLSIGEDGKPEGYDWLDTLDLMGDSGFDM